MAARKQPSPGHRPPFDLAVSLGSDRQVSHQLRGTAPTIDGPFDWVATPFAGLMAALRNDFAGFMEPPSLARCPSAGHVVYDRRYGIVAANDFTEDTPLNNAEVQEKYRLAVGNLRRVLRSGGPVLFVRKDLGRDEAAELLDFLTRLNPACEVLALTAGPQPPWGLPRVTNVWLKPHPAWEGDGDAWAKLLAPFHMDRKGVRYEPEGAGPRRRARPQGDRVLPHQ